MSRFSFFDHGVCAGSTSRCGMSLQLPMVRGLGALMASRPN
ncbi:MAG: hypothetical protein QUV35_03565 [Hydrogenophaga sp.]|nr:hypothetical protein [Hydrogenophaga sp.]MDM7941687.1 hypothetical protein [Hydrogenophaga sp.]